MTKLEPTRTSSDLTATERLRSMLDECGVEWWNQTDPEPQTVTMARLGEQLIEYHENVNGTMGYHVWNMCDLTPEQAIAAALGDVPRLPHFWTHDGALHIEATRMPTRIVVCEGGTCEFVPKRELDASEDENAKLRELVRHLYEYRQLYFKTGIYPTDHGVTEQRMRELGVEVDG